MIKLISCHIENFANLTQKDFNFEAGINTILRENGWGKSTLAGFIKAMFYGLPKVLQKDASPLAIVQARERFMPWEGGKFGGWLIFEVAGQAFKVVRYFGKTEKSDRFELLELRGMSESPSQKYSSNLGEELFSLDRDAFERSAFVTLDPTKAPFKYLSKQDVSGIKNKLLELVEQVDDGCDYQVVQANLNKAIIGLKSSDKSNATGLIPTLTKSVDETKEKLRQRKNEAEIIVELQRELKEKQVQKEELSQILKNLEAEKTNFYLAQKKDYYESRQKQLANLKASDLEKRQFFKAVSTDQAKINEITALFSEYKQNEFMLSQVDLSEADLQQFTKLQNLYANDLPSCDDFENYYYYLSQQKKIVTELNDTKLTKAELEKLNIFEKEFSTKADFASNVKTVKQELDNLKITEHELLKVQTEISEIEKNTSEQQIKVQKEETKIKKNFYLLLVITLLIFVVLLVWAFSFYDFIFLLVVPLIWIVKIKFLARVRGNIDRDLARLKELHITAEKLKDEYSKANSFLHDFFKSFSFLEESSDYSTAWLTLHNAYNEFRQLSQKQVQYNASTLQFKDKLAEITQVIDGLRKQYSQRLNTEEPLEILQALQNIVNQYSALEPKVVAYKNAKQRLVELEEALAKLLVGYTFEPDFDLAKKVSYLEKMFRDLEYSKQAIQAEEKQIEELEKESDFQIWKDIAEPIHSEEEIQAMLLDEREKNERITTELSALTFRIADLQNRSANIPELEADLEQKQFQLTEALAKYENVTLVKSYIEQAHQDLAEAYMRPLIERFNYYWALFNEKTDFRLNNELDIFIDDAGETHGVEFFSSGYLDLMNLCARLALVDVLFKDEANFIILDDPFVNFDAKKISVFKQVLQELSQRRQIFYFTCHESREI